MCDFWRVVGVVFFYVALCHVFRSYGSVDHHIKLFDVDVNVSSDVGDELLEFLFNVVL